MENKLDEAKKIIEELLPEALEKVQSCLKKDDPLISLKAAETLLKYSGIKETNILPPVIVVGWAEKPLPLPDEVQEKITFSEKEEDL